MGGKFPYINFVGVGVATMIVDRSIPGECINHPGNPEVCEIERTCKREIGMSFTVAESPFTFGGKMFFKDSSGTDKSVDPGLGSPHDNVTVSSIETGNPCGGSGDASSDEGPWTRVGIGYGGLSSKISGVYWTLAYKVFRCMPCDLDQ